MASILVVDQDNTACEIVALSLERHGHKIIHAHNGAAAITAIMQTAPQLVLTEIMLPMRSGYDILHTVKSLGLTASLPVVFVTAYSSEREMDRALTAGVSDFVLKPFHPGELAIRVNLALARAVAPAQPVGHHSFGSNLEIAA